MLWYSHIAGIMPQPTKETIVAAWKKKFERWKNARSPVDVAEVEKLLPRVFGSRLREAPGTSHRWHIDVAELVGRPGWVLPNLPIPVRGGQKVIAVYLQRAYQAAELLGLYPPENAVEHENEEDENNEQDG